MFEGLLRVFLPFAVLVAGLRAAVALASGLADANSVAQIMVAFFGFPALLGVSSMWLARSRRRQRHAGIVALGFVLMSRSAGILALGTFVAARANHVPVDLAVAEAAGLRAAAGWGLCIAGLCWGVVCAARILEPRSRVRGVGAENHPHVDEGGGTAGRSPGAARRAEGGAC